eukprot:3920381-Pyramimonas_sp.AAC.1
MLSKAGIARAQTEGGAKRRSERSSHRRPCTRICTSSAGRWSAAPPRSRRCPRCAASHSRIQNVQLLEHEDGAVDGSKTARTSTSHLQAQSKRGRSPSRGRAA